MREMTTRSLLRSVHFHTRNARYFVNSKTRSMKNLVIIVLLLTGSSLSAQTPVDVYNRTFKIPPVSEDTMYFSFAKGDQVVFDFESTTGRDLMEFEVFQYPHMSKLRKDNQVKMKSEKVTIEETGVYWFRLANRSGTERNIKFHIWRIPSSAATKNFNTTVKWKTVSDTSYSSATERYVERRDTNVINREAAMTIQGTSSRYGSTTQCPEFEFPGKVVSWAFYVGVNKQGQQAFQQAEQKFAQTNTTPKFQGYGALAALAFTGKSTFTPVQAEQTVSYSIVDETNASLAKQQQPFKSIRAKKVTNDFSAMKDPQGKTYFYLKNETEFDMEVMVKVSAIVVYERWAEREGKKMEVVKTKIPIPPSH